MKRKALSLPFIYAVLILLAIPGTAVLSQSAAPAESAETITLDIPLTGEERAWIADNPVIRVGGPRKFPPFYWTTDSPEADGIGYDYIRILADNLGMTVEYAGDLPWPDVLQGIRDGKIDLLAVTAKSPEREEFLLFTEPMISSPLVIFSRNDSPYISGLEDLNGITVALIENVTTYDWLKRDNIDVDPLMVSTPQEGLEALSLGEADAYIGNLAAGTYLIGENSLTNIKVAAPTDYGYYNLYMAARKGLPELVPILNKGLAAMTAEQKSRIKSRWISVKYEYGISRSDIIKAVLIVSAVAAILLAVSFLWNRRLAREIAIRIQAEAELSEALDNITELKGLVPICSNCKSIRDDRGYWNNLENYLDEHSDISFSHGLCPDCARKLYGEEKWFSDSKDQKG